MSGESPDWAREQAEYVHIMLVATKDANIETIAQALADAEQRGYERGRKEGIEEAAKVAASGKVHTYTATGYPLTIRPMQYGGLIATAIRQLLEVKG